MDKLVQCIWRSFLVLFFSTFSISVCGAPPPAPLGVASAPTTSTTSTTLVSSSAVASSPVTSTVPLGSLKDVVGIADQKSDKAVDWWARGVAGLGLLVSFGFGLWKMKRDRRLSIEDEFWLRKIITPTAVEPLLKSVVKLLEELPTSASTDRDLAAYALGVTKNMQLHGASVQTLALLDARLPDQVLEHISECEDLFAEYCQSLSQKQVPDSATLRMAVWACINKAFLPIRAWQDKR